MSKENPIKNLGTADIPSLSDKRIASATVEDYLSADPAKQTALLERARIYCDTEPVDWVVKNRLTTLVLSASEIDSLDDAQINDAVAAWSKAGIQLDNPKKRALLAKIQVSLVAPTDSFQEKVDKLASGAGAVDTALKLVATPVAKLSADQINDSLSLGQFKGLVERVVDDKVNPAVFQRLLAVFPTLNDQQKNAILVAKDDDPKTANGTTVRFIQAGVDSRRLDVALAQSIINQFDLRLTVKVPQLVLQAKAAIDLTDADLRQNDAVALTEDEKKAGKQANSGISWLTREQLSALSPEQLAKLPDELMQVMTASQIAGLSQNTDLINAPISKRDALTARLQALIASGELTRFDASAMISAANLANDSALSALVVSQSLSSTKVNSILTSGHVSDVISAAANNIPHHLSREQLSDISVADYGTTQAEKKTALLQRAKTLAEDLTGNYNYKSDSLMLLFLKPAQIKQLSQEQWDALLNTWKSATDSQLPLAPSTDQLKTILDRHRELNHGKSNEQLRQVVGPHLKIGGDVTDSITLKQIGLLNSTELKELVRLWSQPDVKPSEYQLDALFLALRDLDVTATPDELKAVANKTNDNDLKSNLRGLTIDIKDHLTSIESEQDNDKKNKRRSDITKLIASVGPDGKCSLNKKQIGIVFSDCPDEIAKLDPNGMTPVQQAIFVEQANTHLEKLGESEKSKLSPNQVTWLEKRRELTPGAAAHNEGQLKQKQERGSDAVNAAITEKGFHLSELTRHQLQELGLKQLQEIQSVQIEKLTPAQLAGLARNEVFSAQLPDEGIENQVKVFHQRVDQLITLGTLSQEEAAAIGSKAGVSQETHTPSRSADEVQEKLKSPIAQPAIDDGFDFDITKLSRAQMTKIDWTQVHADNQDALTKRREALRRPDRLQDQFKPASERVLNTEGKLASNSRFKQELNDAARKLAGTSFDGDNGLASDPQFARVCERLLRAENAIRVDSLCRQSVSENADSERTTYSARLQEILGDPRKRAFANNPDAKNYFTQLDLDAYVAGNPRERARLSEEQLRKQLVQLMAKSFPDMTKQEYLGIHDSSAFVSTVDAISRSGMMMSDFVYTNGEGNKDKSLVNVDELTRRYELDDKGKLVERPVVASKNLTDEQVSKMSQNLLKAMSENDDLKKDALNKAKSMAHAEEFLVEDHVYREQIKKLDEELKRAHQEAQKLEQKLVQQMEQALQKAGASGHGYHQMRFIQHVSEETVNDIIGWAEGLLSYMLASSGAAPGLIRIINIGKQLKVAREIHKQLTDPNMSPQDVEHLKLILACHQEKADGRFYKKSESANALREYCEKRGIDPKDRWKVNHRSYQMQGLHKEAQVKQEEKQIEQQTKLEGKSRLITMAREKLASLCSYLEDHPNLTVPGKASDRESVYAALMSILNPSGEKKDEALIALLRQADSDAGVDRQDTYAREMIRNTLTRVRNAQPDNEAQRKQLEAADQETSVLTKELKTRLFKQTSAPEPKPSRNRTNDQGDIHGTTSSPAPKLGGNQGG